MSSLSYFLNPPQLISNLPQGTGSIFDSPGVLERVTFFRVLSGKENSKET